jgi:hypothetical protein
MITSVENFEWVPTILILGMSIGWFIVDTVNLRRELSKDMREHDRVFGYVTGLILATLGAAGLFVHFL